MVVNFASGPREALLDCRPRASITRWTTATRTPQAGAARVGAGGLAACRAAPRQRRPRPRI